MADGKNVEVKLTNVRLSYPALWRQQKPKEGSTGSAKFKANFLFSKETAEGKANYEKMKAAIRASAKAEWGDNVPKLKPEKFCMRDGDLENYAGYPGQWYVSANNSKRPQVFDRNRRPLTEEDGKPYAGCYVNAVVRVWPLNSKEYGQRICCSLEGVQFVKDGEAFGAAPLSEDAFEDLGDGEFTDSGSSSEEPDGDSLI